MTVKPSLDLPPVIFGATSLGNLFREIDDSEKSAIVAAWLKAPFDPVVIDSAGKYGAGLSLEVIGRSLAEQQVSPSRVIISNKLGWRRIPLSGPEPTFEPDAWVNIGHDAVQDISYDGILRCWEEGNQLLGAYDAGLVSVHDPDEYLAAASDAGDRAKRLDDIIGAYRALSELREAGQVRATGVGSKDWRIVQELHQFCDFDWVMLANSFTIMKHPPALVDFIGSLHQQSVAVINSALFHGGFLLGGDFYDYQKVDPQQEHFAAALAWRSAFEAACQEFGVSPFLAGLAFGRSHPGISSIALSSSRAERVASHIEMVHNTAPTEFWQKLQQLELVAADYPYLPGS